MKSYKGRKPGGWIAGLACIALVFQSTATTVVLHNQMIDARDYTLTVESDHGTPAPSIGTHSDYCWQSSVTCSVEAVASDGWMFMGWSGDVSTDYTQTNSVVLMNALFKSVTANFSDDADNDGLLNTNELAIGTNPRKEDSDGDGMSDPNELIAGTSPTNSASSFRADFSGVGDGQEIIWYGVAGRYYQLEYTEDLREPWTPIDYSVHTGMDALLSQQDVEVSSSRFYRVRVSDDPASFPEAQDITSGLLAHYKLDGDATDSATYKNNGQAVGVEFVTNRLGIAGRACQFDSTDYIEIPDDPSLNISGPVSIAMWIKADQVGTTQMIFGKSNFSSTTDYILRLTPGGGIQWEYNMSYSANAIIPANEWAHIVVTAGGSTLARRTIYVNGVEKAHTTSGTDGQSAVSNPAMMGAARYWSAPWSEHFTGAMDDLRIYDKELTLDEVQTIYSQEQ